MAWFMMLLHAATLSAALFHTRVLAETPGLTRGQKPLLLLLLLDSPTSRAAHIMLSTLLLALVATATACSPPVTVDLALESFELTANQSQLHVTISELGPDSYWSGEAVRSVDATIDMAEGTITLGHTAAPASNETATGLQVVAITDYSLVEADGVATVVENASATTVATFNVTSGTVLTWFVSESRDLAYVLFESAGNGYQRTVLMAPLGCGDACTVTEAAFEDSLALDTSRPALVDDTYHIVQLPVPCCMCESEHSYHFDASGLSRRASLDTAFASMVVDTRSGVVYVAGQEYNYSSGYPYTFEGVSLTTTNLTTGNSTVLTFSATMLYALLNSAADLLDQWTPGMPPPPPLPPVPALGYSPPPPHPPSSPALAGGWVEQTELGNTSRYHHIVTVAMEALEEEASLDDAVVRRVTTARTQVVAGTNYAIEAELEVPDGSTRTLSLQVFEQTWSDTLELRTATLTHVESTQVQIEVFVHGQGDIVSLDAHRLAELEGELPPPSPPSPPSGPPPPPSSDDESWLSSGSSSGLSDGEIASVVVASLIAAFAITFVLFILYRQRAREGVAKSMTMNVAAAKGTGLDSENV